MKLQDLRIGNVIEYYIEETQTWEKNVVDAEDLVMFEKDQKYFLKQYRPVGLSSERLVAMRNAGSTDILFSGKSSIKISKFLEFSVSFLVNSFEPTPCIDIARFERTIFLRGVKYLHELQNLVFALTGKEMEVVYE